MFAAVKVSVLTLCAFGLHLIIDPVLTLDALIIGLCPCMSFFDYPGSITSHMLIKLVAVFDVDKILQNDHSVLMQPFKGHLEM